MMLPPSLLRASGLVAVAMLGIACNPGNRSPEPLDARPPSSSITDSSVPGAPALDAGERDGAALDGGTDACTDPPCGAACEDGATREQACGSNGRGVQTSECAGGRWPAFGPCVDTDSCRDDTVEHESCGLNGRGSRERTCRKGMFGAFGPCVDVDACLDGAREEGACGEGGQQQRDCAHGQWTEWSACDVTGACAEGASETRGCGFNAHGEQTRRCFDGSWGDFEACVDPDVCATGAAEHAPCGFNGRGSSERTCESGHWGDFQACVDADECRDDQTSAQICGLNDRGLQTRTCQAGRWGDFGPCDDADTCRDAAQQTSSCGLNDRGAQTRVCSAGTWGRWDACVDADQCVDDAEQTRACGLNGRGTERRSCLDGNWPSWGACADTDACHDRAVEHEACGLNRRGQRERSCANGAWTDWSSCQDADACEDGGSRERACGFNGRGVERSSCASGQWGDFGACADPDECASSTVQHTVCGMNRRGEITRRCLDGHWRDESACVDPDVCVDAKVETRSCGLNLRGQADFTCVSGQWAETKSCTDPDECVDRSNESRPCGPNKRGRQTLGCIEGSWVAGSCVDYEQCVDGSVENLVCGVNRRGNRQNVCMEGYWNSGSCVDPDECRDGDMHANNCGFNGRGTTSQTCLSGHWSAWTSCSDPDECRTGTTRGAPCGTRGLGTVQQRCNGVGRWFDDGECSTCVDADGDHYGADCNAGPDCNDLEPIIHPGLVDKPLDGIDQDCVADDEPDVERRGPATFGEVTGVTAVGSSLLVTQGRRLRVLERASLADLGSLELQSHTIDVVAYGSAAYVLRGTLNGGGAVLSVVDVSDPSRPALRSEMFVSRDRGLALARDGSRVFVLHQVSNWPYQSYDIAAVLALDVSVPLAPRRLGYLPSGEARDPFSSTLLASDGRVFLRSYNRIDVFDAQSLALLGNVSFDTEQPAPSLFFGVDGNDLYFSRGEVLKRQDISELAQPGAVEDVAPNEHGFTLPPLVGHGKAEWVIVSWEAGVQRAGFVTIDLATGGRRQVVLDDMTQPADQTRVGNLLYVVGRGGALRVLDLAAKEPSQLVSQRRELFGKVRRIEREAGQSYLVGPDYGLAVVDLVPSGPVVHGTVSLSGDAYDVDVFGHYAYVGTSTGLSIVDVAERDHPRLVSEVPLSNAGRVVVAERGGRRLAYVSTSSVYAVDVTDPTQPGEPIIDSPFGLGGDLLVSNRSLWTTTNYSGYSAVTSCPIGESWGAQGCSSTYLPSGFHHATGIAMIGPYAYTVGSNDNLYHDWLLVVDPRSRTVTRGPSSLGTSLYAADPWLVALGRWETAWINVRNRTAPALSGVLLEGSLDAEFDGTNMWVAHPSGLTPYSLPPQQP